MSLFREQAVRQYSDPEQRGGLLRAAPPSGLRLFVPLALLFVLAAVASAQKVHVTARGRGVIRPASGVHVVVAPAAGRVARHGVRVGDVVEANAPLFTVVAGLSKLDVRAPVAGRIDAFRARDGAMVEAGAPLVRIVPDGGELVAVLAIAAEHRAHLREGSEVRLRLDEHRSDDAGYGLARVVYVSSEPISDDLADPFVASAAKQTPHYEVELEPLAMPPRAEGGFRSGMTFTGEIVLHDERIIALLF